LTFNGTTLTANTIGAFTLSGTVAGGGNQLNNVVIGTTTPLAGAFTTLSATGAVTSGSDFKVPTLGYLYAYTGAGSGTVKAGFQFDGAGAIYGKIADTTVTNISSTGLAVTGTLSATGLTLDSSGNLGLGVTPSAWASGWKALQLANGSSFVNNGATNYTGIFQNVYYNGTNNLYLSSTYALKYELVNGTHAWYNSAAGTAGNAITFTQAMTLDASGNLGVGTTSPAVKLQVQGAASSNPEIRCLDGTVNSQWYAASNGTCVFGTYSNHPLVFRTNGSESARIDTSGNLLVGTTSAGGYKFNVTALGGNYGVGISTGNTGIGLVIGNTSSGSQTFEYFVSAGTNVGSITTNGTITVYNTTSDYRLKTVIGAVSESGKRIDALEPVEYTWNSNGSRARGFLAHQFQEVYPDSVSGTKDAVDADGKPKYQAMQAGSSEVIADLVAEIQSLRARVAQLETKGV
jgi:hypothetical protein